LNCGGGSIGHDAGAATEPATYAAQFHFGTALVAVLQAVVANREVVDVSTSLAEIRAVLTDPEIELAREACAAASVGFHDAKGRIQPGLQERNIGGVLAACISNAAGRPRAGAFGFCMSGPNSADAYRAYQMPGERALRPGDVALLHANSFVQGIWTDITRTYSLGDMPPRVASVHDAIRDATDAALAAIRPGVTGSDVDRAARNVMQQAGYGREFKHATGHGVGLAAIDHNARPRIHATSADVLEPGMVFNIEPAAYFPNEFGVRQCNMVLVTPSGCELLTNFDLATSDLVLPAC
jgi:Xaa-Pro dipeptidase